jgi:hypothetical protein
VGSKSTSEHDAHFTFRPDANPVRHSTDHPANPRQEICPIGHPRPFVTLLASTTSISTTRAQPASCTTFCPTLTVWSPFCSDLASSEISPHGLQTDCWHYGDEWAATLPHPEKQESQKCQASSRAKIASRVLRIASEAQPDGEARSASGSCHPTATDPRYR